MLWIGDEGGFGRSVKKIVALIIVAAALNSLFFFKGFLCSFKWAFDFFIIIILVFFMAVFFIEV